MIQVEHVSKQFQLGEDSSLLTMRDVLARSLNPRNWGKPQQTTEFKALNDVSFQVNQGEVVGLIGRNGAGKSTLLKILSRITPPSQGKVTLHGRVASLLEVGTGFHPELTGRENIYLNGVILGMTKREISRKFDEIVEFAEISKFLDTPVKRYSSGMYVRLAFAVAAHLEPEILLVDEVLAVGDIQFQKKCLGKMSEVTQRDGRTIIFVSHNLGAIQKLCQRAVVMRGGQVIADAQVDQAIHAYLQDISSTSAHIDLAARTDRQGSGRVRITSIRFEDAVTGQIVNTFHSTQAARIRFTYQAKEATDVIKQPTISMAISNQMGEIILNLVNTATGDQFTTAPTQGEFVLDIPKLSLVPGQYYFNTFVTVNNEIADWVLEAGSFQVEFSDFFGSGQMPPEGQGNILLEHHWSVR